MAHTPSKMTIEDARAEIFEAWERSYSAERNAEAIEAIKNQPIEYRIGHLVARLFFRGIYFPQMKKRDWMKLLFENSKAIIGLTKEGFSTYRKARKNKLRSAVKDSVYE